MSKLLAYFAMFGFCVCTLAQENLILNGDFEIRGMQMPEGVEMDLPIDFWDTIENGVGGSIDKLAQYNINFHENEGPAGPVGGLNYGTVMAGDGDRGRVIQTIDDVLPNVELTLSGFMWGCSSWPPDGDPDGDYNHLVRLWEGGPGDPDSETPLAEYVMDNADHCIAWFPFVISGTPSGSTVTVEFGYQGGDASWAGPATYVDQIRLLVSQQCNDPFADLDWDGDVDQSDFAEWQRCFTGDVGSVAAGCDCADAEPNLRVNDLDLIAFEACASGPDVPADPCCDGGAGCP